MATLQGKITDVTHRPPESLSSITVKAPSVRVGGGTDLIVSSPATVDFDRGTGDVTISGLTGGLSWLHLEGEGWSDSIALSVAEGMISLVEAIANASGAPGIIDYLQLLADFKIRFDETAQDAVDDAASDIKWHQDTPDSSWDIEDFPKGIWKVENAEQRTRLGLPNSNGVLAMHVFSPDRQGVATAKAAYWLSMSHTSPTEMLIRSTSNTGVWEPEWRNTYDGYKPPSKQAAVPLTFPRGSSYSDDRPTLTIRIPFKLGAAVKRARLRLRNYDYRSNHGFPGSYRIVGAGIGKHQINDDGSMTGLVPEGESVTQLMGSTQMAGPDEAAGDWVDINLEANTDYLLSYSFTADDGMVYTRQTAQCFTNRLSSGWSRTGTTTATPSNMAVLAAILDVEVLEDTPIYGYLGDSQTAAISASRPGYDSWAMVHSRLAGAIPTIHGHAGGGLNEWQDPGKPAYAISEGMARFDRFHISMGSNDISSGRPYTGVQQYLTTAMQNWRNQTDTFVLHNYLPRTSENPTDTVRNALNDWILNDLPGNSLYAVDVYGATVDPVTGLIDERWRGSINDVHMNSAGNTRVALATVAGTSGSGRGETAAAIAAAESAAAAAVQAATSADTRATSAESKADNSVSRVDALEAMAGLSPESPVDGQTANLVAQPDTLTHAAIFRQFGSKEVAGQGVMDALYRSGAALRNIHAALNSRTEETCRLLFFGSSTTQGYNAPDLYGYVSLLGEMIQAAFPNTTGTEIPLGGYSPVNTPGVQIVNLGRGNSNSGDYVVRENASYLNNVALLKPKVVFHMIGANDWNIEMPPATYKANVQWTIDAIDDVLPAPAVHVLIHQHERLQHFPRDYPFSAYRDALREIALSDPDQILLIDLTADWEMMGVPVPNPYGLLDTDNVHLTGRGHAFLAETLRERLAIPLLAHTATAPPGDVTPPDDDVPPPPEEFTLVMVTSDGFGDDSTSLGTRPSDVAHGGTPITPSVINSPAIFTSGGNLVGGPDGGNLTWAHSKQDVELSIALVEPTEDGPFLIYSRWSSVANSAGAKIKIGSIGAAVLTVNDIEYGGNQAYQAGDTIAVRSVGNVHQLLINGSVKATATVSGVTGGSSRATVRDGLRLDDMKIAEVIPG